MRRLVTLLTVVVLAGIVSAAVALRPASAGSTYRVDVILDDAHGLIPGQLVQIAGAKVGSIDDVVLTPDFKARVKMKVQSQFAPFRQDATCTIRPQGLIAENYVDCDPGSPDAPALKGDGDNAPTVPVGHTTAPVPVTDLFDIWDAPVRDRLTLLVNELGIATAGRGQDINDILRRANPSLKLARQVISVLYKQKTDLATILDKSDTIFGTLATNNQRIRDFLDQAAETTTQTGEHASQLQQGVKKLPQLLDATEPALRDLNTVVRQGTPLVHQLHVAAPYINRLNSDIGPFATQSKQTVAKLSPVLTQGTKTLKKAIPLMRIVKSFAHNSRPAAEQVGPLFTNLRDKGFIENFLTILYRGAAVTSRFDATSHIFPAYVTLGTCAAPATTPVAGCSANFTQTTAAAKTKQSGGSSDAPAASGATPATPSVPSVHVPTPTVPQAATQAPKTVGGAVQKAIDTVIGVLTPPKTGGDGSSSSDDKKDPVKNLLGYLLG